MQGFTINGYFQEYVVVEARGAMVLPTGVDVTEAAPLFCAGVTAFHGVEDCECESGDWMAIIGCGGLGHLVRIQVFSILFQIYLICIGHPIRQSDGLESHRY
jgi:D-arabinose 1-dehydrogenase-like Zn-dependent alcohol dehydrogenase